MTVTFRESTAFGVALILGLAILALSILAFDAGWNYRAQQERWEHAEWREKVQRVQMREQVKIEDRILRAEAELRSMKAWRYSQRRR